MKIPYKVYRAGHGEVASATTPEGANLAIWTLIHDEFGQRFPQGIEKQFWIIINWEDD